MSSIEWGRVLAWLVLSSAVLAAGLRLRRRSKLGYLLICVAIISFILLLLAVAIALTAGTDGRWI